MTNNNSIKCKEVKEGDTCRVTFYSKITYPDSDKLPEIVSKLFEDSKIERVVFDFEAVNFIDSSGLGNLFACNALADEFSKNFALEKLQPRVKQSVDSCELHELVEIV